jgi:hypothetical protein
MNEQLIYDKIKVMLDRMEQKKQLQSLAKTNGIELNEMELTDDTSDAIVISVIALMLAKMDNDERYRKLCDFGMQKRSLKVEIINDYKQRANMLYNKYKNGDVPSNDIPAVDDVPYDESFMYDTDDMDEEYFDESSKSRKEIRKRDVLGFLAGAGGTIVLGFTSACLVPFVHMTLLELIAASAIAGGIGDLVGGHLACNELVPTKYAKHVVESIGDVLATMVKTEDEDVVTNIRKFKKANKNLFDELRFWLPSYLGTSSLAMNRKTRDNTWNSLPDDLKRSHEDMMNLCSKMSGLKAYSKNDVKEYVEAINDLLNKTVKITKSGETAIQEGYNESAKSGMPNEAFEEGFGFTTKKNICNRVCEQIDIINPFMEELHKKIDDGEIKDPKTFQKWYRQDVKVSYGISGGSTTYGDSYTGTSVNYEYGEPTLENYILRAKQVIRMSTRNKYVGTVFTREEHDKLERAFMLLYNLNINMSDCCGDYFNSFKEYNPNQYKGLLKKVNDDITEWIDLSKEIYDFASSKIH